MLQVRTRTVLYCYTPSQFEIFNFQHSTVHYCFLRVVKFHHSQVRISGKMNISKSFMLMIFCSIINISLAFNSQVSKLRFRCFGSRLHNSARQSMSITQHMMTMRDASACYWFHVGDLVRVVGNVPKAGINLRNRVGKVVSRNNFQSTCRKTVFQ